MSELINHNPSSDVSFTPEAAANVLKASGRPTEIVHGMTGQRYEPRPTDVDSLNLSLLGIAEGGEGPVGRTDYSDAVLQEFKKIAGTDQIAS